MKKTLLVTLALLFTQTSFAVSATEYLLCKKGTKNFIAANGYSVGGSVSGTDLTVEIYGKLEGGSWEKIDLETWNDKEPVKREKAFEICGNEIKLWDIDQACADGDKDTYCAKNIKTLETFSDDYDDVLEKIADKIKTKFTK